MNKGPLVSIIVPVFNVEQYVEKCLCSICNQSYNNLEIIVVNDGSTDLSQHKCEQWANRDSRIKLFNKQNGGLSSARNFGIDVSSGDYVGFVDSDDYLSKNAVEEMLEAIFDSKNLIGQTLIEDVYPNRSFVDTSFYDFKEENYFDFLKGICLQKRSSSVCSKLFPRSFFNDLRFDVGKTNEDFLLFFNVTDTSYSFCCTHTVGYYYNHRTNSITHNRTKAYKQAIYNSLALLNRNDLKTELVPYVQRFFLHYCFSYFVAESKSREKRDKQFNQLVRNEIKSHKKVLGNTFLSKTEKCVLKLFIISPRMTRLFIKICAAIRRPFKHDN